MYLDDLFFNSERLYGYSPARTYWNFPKAQTLKRLATAIKCVNQFTNAGKMLSVGELAANLESQIPSRVSKGASRDSLMRLVEMALFMKMISLTKNSSRGVLMVSATPLGLAFVRLLDEVKGARRSVNCSELLSFVLFAMLWHSSFDSGATKTAQVLDNVHPIRAVFTALVKQGRISYRQLCENFYGFSDDVDFLSDARQPKIFIKPNVNWEYIMSSLTISGLVKLQAGVHAMRYYVPDEYRPNALIEPTNLLLNFIHNGPHWSAMVTAYMGNGFRFGNSKNTILGSDDTDDAELVDALEVESLAQRTVLVNQRLRQDIFRDRLLAEYKSKCLLCDITDERLLQAAHVVPVGHIVEHEKKEKNGKSLAGISDPFNGILLCANHHLAYDKNLFEILPNGETHDLVCDIALHCEDKGLAMTFQERKVDLHSLKRLDYFLKRNDYATLARENKQSVKLALKKNDVENI